MDKKIMTHIVAGYPTMAKCEELAILMAKNGASFIEIQIPFSDPVADGPVIMAANKKALENGVKTADCFALMKRLGKKIHTPLLFMTYFNILHHYGVEKFIKKARECGCYGLIVPDMPIDEEANEHYLEFCLKYAVNPIQIVSPLTTDERLKKIAKAAKGFVYCVARYGTTGTKNGAMPGLDQYIKKVRKYVSLPLAVGFGISNKDHIELVHQYADIAVIGSKILGILEEKGISAIEPFLQSLLSKDKKPRKARRIHSAKRKPSLS